MTADDAQLAPILAVLERTPRALDALLRGQPATLTHQPYGPGTWSAFHVMGHLIAGERRDWIPRARIILTHGPDRPFDPFPHDATVEPSSGTSLDALLDQFAALRAENLSALGAMKLTREHLALRGTHPALGVVTLAQLLATWAAHDLHHIRQVGQAMVYQFREQVGPWRAYLNSLPADPPG